MKSIVICLFILLSFQFTRRPDIYKAPLTGISATSGNVFIITLDGFRWQEVFNGADSLLINDEKYTPDTSTIKSLYWSPDQEGRRKKLLPFFWNVVAAKGQLYGNRKLNNKVNTSNPYCLSYPGYNEIFTGNADPFITSNAQINNPNVNVLSYLSGKAGYKDQIAAFTSWEAFPYIFNKDRSGFQVNSGYCEASNEGDEADHLNRVHNQLADRGGTREDLLTYLLAKNYIRQKRPRILFLGFGETDEAAHNERYDLYLEKATEADRMIAELWHYVQTTPGYKDNTTFIITTDHGRGKKSSTWSGHGMLVSGSSQTWIAVIGPHIPATGEMKCSNQLYQKQIAQTIASLIGEQFESEQSVASSIQFKP